MRTVLSLALASVMWVTACGESAGPPAGAVNPAGPTAAIGSGSAAAQASGGAAVELPFHSEITWTKVVNGGSAAPCQGLHGNPPAGMVYLMRNTSEGPAVSSHLGAGVFEIHTCVYGSSAPAGWFADMRWTAANGDELLATSTFVRWATEPGARFAIDKVTFQDGGSGRFQFAEGEAESHVYVSGPLKGQAFYDGSLRYGKKEK